MRTEKKTKNGTEPPPLRWVGLGTILDGFELEAAYVTDGIVAIRAARNKSQFYARLTGETSKNACCVLSSAVYGLNKEAVKTLLSLFPKEQKKGKK